MVAKPAEIVLPCPICRNATQHLDAPPVFKLRRCFACQTVFLDTSPQQMADYASELEQQYFGAEFVAKDNNWVAHYERWSNQRTLRRISQALAPGQGQLLEVGIGSGRFLNTAVRAGWQVAGIEASPVVAEHARQRYRVPIFVGSLDEYDKRLGKAFQAVVMNHVLEHFADPKKALLQVKNLLKVGGILHLAVPNFGCWEAKLSGWTSYQPYHLYYFDRESLTCLLEDCGFKVLNVSYQEPFSGWVNAILHTMLRTSRVSLPQAQGALDDLQSGKVKAFLRHSFEATRLAAGGLLLPLRMMQCFMGKGEEMIILASALDGN